MDREILVQNIKLFCKKKGVKQTVACRESGVGVSFVNDIVRGQTPSVAKVQMLADYLGVTTSELLGEKQPATGEGDLSPDAFSVLAAYQQATPELQAAVRRVLGIDDSTPSPLPDRPVVDNE